MRARIADQPLFLLMMGIAALAMFLPAAHALYIDVEDQARAFFYSGTLLLVLTVLIAVARTGRPVRRDGMWNLLALLGGFTVLPAILAVPFHDALRTTSFLNAYFEMVSSLTTTGASMFAPDRLSPSLHLWRAMVGWLGGLLMWVAAAAVLAPLSLGGFEVTASGEPGQTETGGKMGQVDPQQRILRVAWHLTPIYAGLTLALWLMLLVGGDRPLVAISHAMSVMATSGISPVGGVENAGSGLGGEMVMALFMLFALSRVTFSGDTLVGARVSVFRDPEFRLGLGLALVIPLVLFLRHWSGAYDFDEEQNFLQALHALWGGIFTILSMLTTTGFASADWAEAQSWSGLPTPGLILLGVAMIGGGVATTAGGVKLLRVWALYLQGLREMERLVHPSSVGRSGAGSRRLRRQGAYIAWIFFMLFALSVTVFTLVMAWIVRDFEQALVLTIAALSTTGPLVTLATETPIVLVDLGVAGKLVMCAAMVLGRLETLAIIALASSDLWRR
ncbi:TrkH family potassium uptake protein [Lutimaribacter sp. EGI FJ00015]|uniref:TrkH family potassium uptake protein n=1 Tax=Lutimaribacter degradans TaxID=2945989 RepID=A0ACC5ZS15_9RHOB|nr:potassium transporter TrkG [Lutimaribacter sp. EGI FJ00013]MCM2561101.1 TrkH family potassium uptake protein [Lutimaribacter sp. EGI FJ00013]MCO0611950.1 TrkH family potassium uptake protein [Lutimaribacter sp. EGI FJ00015]MCO0634929.1 TrkH family potassium uptake protein [Lutimaribacter sp. EGI FJ00014]